MSTSGMHRRPFEGRHLVIYLHALFKVLLQITKLLPGMHLGCSYTFVAFGIKVYFHNL